MKVWLRRNVRWAVPGALAAVGVGLWLFFGYFGFHTLFIDDKVNEEIPVFTSGAGASGLPSDASTDAEVDEANDVMAEEGTPTDDPTSEPIPETSEPEIIVQYSGPFVDRSHPTKGTADILTDGSSQRFLRFEDFATDNGPDLNVYLSTAPVDADADQFDDDAIDLGDLKGNIGPQNYEIPESVDLDRYTTVVIWCVRFGVAFGAAALGAA
jgi:hypothetical protein